ncbi:MAG TPA: hypothetical protein VIY56_10480, partial [Vicinamibacterales bacterium]
MNSTPVARWAVAGGVCLALGVLLFAASFTVGRSGFSPDEEITALVVRGIAETGAPVLPSGMVYLRGLPYSYAAWLSGAVFGHELVAYRATSLAFALLAVVLIFLVTRAVSTPAAGVVAALVFAASPLLLSAAVFARFYSAFVAAALFAVWWLLRSRAGSPLWPFLLALAACRSLHEFGFVVALAPACLAFCRREDDPTRRPLVVLFAQSIALLIVTQIGLTTLEGWSIAGVGVAPTSGLGAFSHAPAAMPPLSQVVLAGPWVLFAFAVGLALLIWQCRRITGLVWAPAAFAVCAFFFQGGVFVAVLAAACLMTPRDAGRTMLAALIVGVAGETVWVAHTFAATDIALSAANVWDVALSTASYPWEAVWHFAEEAPFALALFAGIALFCVLSPGASSQRADLRAVLLFGFAAVMALGVSALEFQWRYTLLVLPFVLAGASSVVGVFSLASPPVASAGWYARRAIAGAAIAILVLSGAGSLQASRSGNLSVPTSAELDVEAFSSVTRPGDALVCNDEMACRFLAGRSDYWLLPRPDIASQYVVQGAGGPRSIYGGAPVLTSLDELHAVVAREHRAVAIVILDTGKFDFEQVREMAVQLATSHGGTVSAVGGRHLVVRLRHADRLPASAKAPAVRRS